MIANINENLSLAWVGDATTNEEQETLKAASYDLLYRCGITFCAISLSILYYSVHIYFWCLGFSYPVQGC